MLERRRTIAASSLRDGMLVDFEDGEPAEAKNVRHLSHKVLFDARGEKFTLDRDEVISIIFLMLIVG